MDCCKQAFEEIFELFHTAKEYLILSEECKKTHPSLSKTYLDHVSTLISMCEKLHNQVEEDKEYEFEENLYDKKLEKIRFKYMLHSK